MIDADEESNTSDGSNDTSSTNLNFQDWLDDYGSDNDERTWKDNEVYGDLLENKITGTTRFYFCNIHGTKESAKWEQVCSTMQTLEVDIAGFSEINLDTSKEHVRLRMEQSARKTITSESIIITSTTPLPAADDKKPGGTSLLTIGGGMCSRVGSIFKDGMGRWSAARYICDDINKGLWVVSVYQVCDGIIDPTSFTAARQQEAMINDPSIKPREAFKRDLKEFVKKYPTDEFLIGGDFNEESTSAAMNELIDELHLFDLISARHGDNNQPNTYIRGTKRMDYMLGTESVAQALTNCGFDPFGVRFSTDHRGMWADLDTLLLFGNATTIMPMRDRRGLDAKQPRDVLNWVTETAKYLRDHKMNDRLQHVRGMENPDHDYIERFDKDLTRGSLRGEKMVSKLRPRSHWSPEFADAWAKNFFYSQASSFHRNKVKMRSTLQSIKERYDILDPIPHPRDINRLRKAAQRALKKIRLKAREIRREFLRLKAEAYAAAENKKAETILKRMQQATDMSNVYTKIKKSQEASAGGVDKLEVPLIPGTPPKQCQDWQTITVPREIEDALLSRNQEHFGQAEGTPCTSALMKENLGYRGDGYAAELILDGHFQNDQLDEITSLFLKHLQRRTTANKIKAELSREQFLSKIKNWPEKTSTSPSKLHLGMYHSLRRPCGLEPRDNQPMSNAFNKFSQDRDLIIECRLAVINYALRFGYSLDRWKDVENVMLRKDVNNCRIHRLRVIHIYEADYI